jgi:hypothetical protein
MFVTKIYLANTTAARDSGRRTPDARDDTYVHSSDSRQYTNDSPRSFYIDPEDTRSDLSKARPEWPLSAYAGGGVSSAQTPKHLFGGLLEQSPEEVRVAYYLARLQGNEQGAVRYYHTCAVIYILIFSATTRKPSSIRGQCTGAEGTPGHSRCY